MSDHPITIKYAALGGASGLLGASAGALGGCPDGVGSFQHFANGSIYWHPDTGAFEVHGAIRDRWQALGWELSWLGYPISDELIDGAARRSKFQNGRIDWSAGTGAIDRLGVAVEAYADRSFQGHQDRIDDLRPKGWRPISISIWEVPGATASTPVHDRFRYAAVWVPQVGTWRGVHGADDAAFGAFLTQCEQDGYRLTLLSVAGTAAQPFYAAVAVASSEPMPLVRVRLVQGSESEYETWRWWCAYAANNRMIPTSISVYGAASARRIACIFEHNADNVAWNIDSAVLVAAEAEKQRQVQTAHHAFPYTTARAPDGASMTLYRAESAGPYELLRDRTGAAAGTDIDTKAAAGYYPTSIQGGAGRFDILVAKREDLLARRVAKRGLAVPELRAFDDAVIRYMKIADIRAASVAIADRERLVYARAFTWAAPTYPIATPRSIFRVGSCSKLLTAIMIRKLLSASDNELTADKHVKAFLELVPPPQMTQADPNFDLVKIFHLLTHTSGVSPQFNGIIPAAVDLFKATPAVTAKQAVSNYLLTRAMEFVPGAEYSYCNSGFLLLSAVIEQITQKPWYAALKSMVLDPLGLTRPQVTGSTIVTRAANEVLYHDRRLLLVASQMPNSAPQVREGYGNIDYAVGDGVGGMALGAADFVKILAALSDPVVNSPARPLMSKLTRDDMWTPEANALPGPYVGGWDTSTSHGLAVHGHGGYAPNNAHATVFTRSDGVSFAAMFNSDSSAWASEPAWHDLLASVSLPGGRNDWTVLDIPAFTL